MVRPFAAGVLCAALLTLFIPRICRSDPAPLAVLPAGQSVSPPPSPEPPSGDFIHRWIFGLRGGLSNPIEYNSLYYYRAPGDLYADIGPYVSASALYGVARYLMVGLDVDYDSLPFSQAATGIGIGTSQTVTIVPEAEVRSNRLDSFVSVYGTLGLGMTVNTFSKSSSFANICDLEALGCLAAVDREAIALRMAIGVDFFMTEDFAINAELGGIYTSANATLTVNPNDRVSVFDGSGNLSTVFFLFGFHFLPPKTGL